jgi:protein TonB
MLEALPPPGTLSRECARYPCPPAYPQTAIRERLEGDVVLRVRVAADGTVLEATVLNASGHRVLDEAAIRNVSARRFPVYTPLGSSTSACYTVNVPITFRFDGSGDEG